MIAFFIGALALALFIFLSCVIFNYPGETLIIMVMIVISCVFIELSYAIGQRIMEVVL